MGKVLLNRFVSSTFKAEQEAGLFDEPDPLKKVYGYLDYIARDNKEPGHQIGCLIGSFAQVLSDTHPEIRLLCDRHFSWWAGLVKEVLDDAKALYAPQKDIDTQGLALHVIAVIEGSLILARARQDAGVVESSANNLKDYLSKVFGR
jgi:TetR/AcrR family transcriptional repressor of nem operon